MWCVVSAANSRKLCHAHSALGGKETWGGEPGSVSAPYFIFITELSMVIGFIQNVLHNNFLPVLLGGLCGHSREVGGDLKGPL